MIFLQKKSLIDPGCIINHEWLKSRNKISEKFPFDFPKKKEIFDLILVIEQQRDLLCYGKPQKLEALKQIIETLHDLKVIFKEAGLDEI